jgi:7-cyano-7-deazaguanine synthase
MSRTVIILSGGMDSTTLLYDLHSRGHELFALSFDYGQKHARELECAVDLCAGLQIPHYIVDLAWELGPLLSSSLTRENEPIPTGHYQDESMKSTVVPNRNMIMLSVAAGYAITIGANAIAYAAHAGDHAIYPDCRPVFREALQGVLNVCHYEPIELVTPYIDITKGDICAIGRDLGVPYQLTWTCYLGEEYPCGKCGACTERREAFDFAGIPDPLEV